MIRNYIFILNKSHQYNRPVRYFLNKNAAGLTPSNLPKLLLYTKPGMLTTKKVLDWSQEHLPMLETQYVGKAKHLMEEDLPHEIVKAIRAGYEKLE